ncbi:MAG: glycosyltransferase [Cetobacterium sp.]|uniref:glycosyltransferase n=1 Tax=Cetobacterium sp. TaxID=2071632 RepID=UPI003F414F50
MVGIIILNYNSSKLVKKLCENLKNIKNISKIVIVDNDSTDNSINELKNIINSKIDLISSKENRGYSAGNNKGIKYIIRTYKDIEKICILNPDVEILDEEIFDKLSKELERDSSLGIISPFMLMNGKKKINLTYWKVPQGLDNIFLSLGLTNKLYKKLFWKREVIPGSFLFFSKTLIKEIDFLDEEVFLYQEENILFQKLKSINKKMKIIESIYYNHNHEHKDTSLNNKLFHNRVLFDSMIYYEKKYNKKYSFITIKILKFFIKLRKIELKLKDKFKQGD